MPWVETASPSFTARHSDGDTDDVDAMLDLLESTRAELALWLEALPPAHVDVVVHPSRAQLYAAQPHLMAATRLTAPAGRRYLSGCAGPSTLHLLAPRLLTARASNVPGSRDMAMLAPVALYVQLALGRVNPRLPPPLRPSSLFGLGRWAWLTAGAGQWLSGQSAYVRPAIARRLREGREPAFPPGSRDALLLGGSVLELLARENGDEAAVLFARTAGKGSPRAALAEAFSERPLGDTEGTWRADLTRLAGQA